MLVLLVLTLTGFVVAQYGVPAVDPAPAYAAAVPVYAPQPVVLPQLPAAHEILFPRRHHHRRHGHRHSRSSSSSESHEHKPRCARCKSLTETACPSGSTTCIDPEIKYFTHKGCKAAYIECRKDNRLTQMLANQADKYYIVALAENLSGSLLKCSGEEWKAVNIEDGKPVGVDTVGCYNN